MYGAAFYFSYFFRNRLWQNPPRPDSLSLTYYWADGVEANFLLHKKQYLFEKEDIHVARILISNKIQNQIMPT